MTKIEEVPLRELLYQLLPKNGVGAELGVQQGINAVQLFHCSKPKKMYLVDLWQLKFAHLQSYRWDDWTESIKNSFADEIQSGKVKLHKKDRLDFLSQLDDNYLDWAYVDTTHTYIDTKKEAELLIKKVKPNGYIAFHDFTTASHAWGTGVVRAVIERINTGELLATHITNEQFPTILCKNIK
jgi:hypothetical protein